MFNHLLTPTERQIAIMTVPEIIEERKLILEKKSKLSSYARQVVCHRFDYLVKTGAITVANEGQ